MERQDFSTFPISNHGHRGLLNEIKKLDPDDSIGVVRRLTFNTLEFAERQVEPLLRDKKYAQAHELIDREFADPRNDTPLKQHLLAMRFRVFQAEEKLDDAVATLRDIVKLDPKGKMGSLADGYIDFSIKPIVLKNGRYCGLDLRPFFGDMRIDVTGIVKEAGPYEAAIIPGGGGDIRIRDVSLYLGDPAKDKSRSKLVVKTEGMHTVRNKELVVPLAVPSIPPGSQLWLCVPTQGTGWFGSYGRIELRKK